MAGELVTVFGGSGFLGRHIVRRLGAEGYRVRVAVRNPNTAHFLRPMGNVGQIQLVKCNVTNEASVAAALEGADAAINLVGIRSETGKQKFHAVHGEAAGRVAKLAAEARVKTLIHLSAIGADIDAGSKFARTKGAGELAVREAFPEATILRPSVVYGPEDRFFNKVAVIARYLPVLPLIGGGNTKFQPVYVGDVAEATLNALGNASARGRTFELGGPTVYSLRDVIQLVLRESERERPLVPYPFAFARLNAFFLGLLPKPLLTLDQVRMLESDNVVTSEDGIGTLADLGVASAQGAEGIIGSYLYRFRRYGQYEMSGTG